MKLPNTSIRMWPAIIATNSRRPRLNGRTMKEMNSIAAISGTMHHGRPMRNEQREEVEPWRQNPTISTIEKLITASTPVIEKWLVVVKLMQTRNNRRAGGGRAGSRPG